MKLIIAILQDEDAGEAISHLNEAGFQVTRLATKGGFLRAGNTTLLAGVENEKVDEAIKIIEENSKARTQYATLPSSCGAMHGFILAPIEVKVGGATVFVGEVRFCHKQKCLTPQGLSALDPFSRRMVCGWGGNGEMAAGF